MSHPDFFIVGAPKCGTTTLYHYLRQHPQVFMPERKEPHFYSVDIRVPGAIRNPVEYAALFQRAGDARRIGEASVSYLASRAAPPAIHRVAPDARIIVMLRDPVAVVASLHQQLVYECEAEHTDLAEALRIQREARDLILSHKGTPYIYREAVRFAEQIQRYLDRFDGRQVHVVLLDDLRDEPGVTFEGVLRFLDVDPGFTPRFDVINPRKRARSAAAQRWLKHPPRPLAAITGALPGRVRGALSAWSLRVNTTDAVSAPEVPADLRRELADEVESLRELLGRRLRGWGRG